MSSTIVYGVGDTVPVDQTPGLLLQNVTVPAGQSYTLEAINLKFVTVDAADAPEAYVFHLFMTPTGGTVGSPFWVYARRATDPDAYQTRNYFPKMRINGPASGGFVVINVTGRTQYMYWSSLWSVDP